jgi:hypothetical protein
VIVRTICVLLALGAFGSAGARDTWIDEDELVAQTLILAPGEKDRLIRLEEENVLTIRPVALPRGENLHGRNNLGKTYLYRGETRLLLFGPFTRSERIDSRSMRSSRENEQTYTTVR